MNENQSLQELTLASRAFKGWRRFVHRLSLAALLLGGSGWCVREHLTDAWSEWQYRSLLQKQLTAAIDINVLWKESNLYPSTSEKQWRLLQQKVNVRMAPLCRDYEMFLRKHPAHDRAMTSYGTFLDDMGKKDAALGWWSRALYLSHHNPNLLNNLANHYSHYGQPLLAIQLYEAAVRLSPKEAVYHFNLGNMYWLFRKETAHIHGWDTPTMLAQAMEQFKLAREYDRSNFEYASSYAETFYAMNFLLHNQPWQEAMAAWEHCLNMELAPEQRDFVHVHLVRISTYLRDPMTALRCFSKIRGQAHRKLAFQLLERAFPCSFAGPLQV